GSPVFKAVFIALALASADLALGACWAVPIDIAPDYAGVITGCMNTRGNIGGLIGPLVVGIAVEQWHSWTFPFYVTALVYAGGRPACSPFGLSEPPTPIAKHQLSITN